MVPSAPSCLISSQVARRPDGVQPGGRLVEEQQLGLADDAQPDVEAALLAAGQRLDPGAGLLGQAHQLQHLVHRPGIGVVARVAGRAPGAPTGTARPRAPAARCPSGSAASAGSARLPGSTPSTCTVPASRVRKPSRISIVVVLPAPFGPSSAKTSPGSTVKLTSATACTEPYDLRRFLHADSRHRPPLPHPGRHYRHRPCIRRAGHAETFRIVPHRGRIGDTQHDHRTGSAVP